MKQHNLFSFKRLAKLIINDAMLHRKSILVSIAFTIFYFASFGLVSRLDLTQEYLLYLYIGGFLTTAYAFNDLNNRAQAQLYLMLPCSNLERLISKWFLTSVVFSLGSLLLWYFMSILPIHVHDFIYQQHTAPFNVFQRSIWMNIGTYMFLQPIFLLGAISFRKQTIIKTTLFTGSFVFALGSFLLVLIGLVFYYVLRKELSISPARAAELISFLMSTANITLNAFLVILAPFCLHVTYLKLKEIELR